MSYKNKDKIEKSELKKTVSTDLWCWIVVVLVIISVVVIRGRLLTIPLTRDEGEYAYIAQQMLKGVPPYVSAYSMKLPGIYAVYALFFILFGQTITAINLGLIIFNALTILIIFLLAKRMFDSISAVVSAAAYAVMSLTRSVFGLFANAEHFVILPALAGILLLHNITDKNRYLRIFAAGLLLGLAFIIKQHGIFFGVFGASWLLYSDLYYHPIKLAKVVLAQLIFFASASIPFILICLFYWHIGVFDKFWFWTFTYAHKYVAELPFSKAFENFYVHSFYFLVYAVAWTLAFALLGLYTVLILKHLRPVAVFTTGLLFFSFLSVCPGFYFRGHYFIFLLPAIAILAGEGSSVFCTWAVGRNSGLRYIFVAALVGLIVIAYPLFNQRRYLFYGTPSDICHRIWVADCFPESLEIAKYIKQNSLPTDTVAVIGSEPQICFYSNRRSATRYIYTYPLMEIHPYAVQMQKEMIAQIEDAKPEFMVSVNIDFSWELRHDSIRDIFTWFKSYVDNYQLVGKIEIQPNGQTVYNWNVQTAGHKPLSKYWVTVFKRRH
ncbi:MAG: glycosyltransferase family 39 protein [Sedimentisphaerales bacterium]